MFASDYEIEIKKFFKSNDDDKRKSILTLKLATTYDEMEYELDSLDCNHNTFIENDLAFFAKKYQWLLKDQ